MIASYPPAPWHLNGTAFLTFKLIDIHQARASVPADFRIISVFPGKTIGGLYFSIYDEDSTLTYSEMIVVTGLIQNHNQVGFWISHIYVDNPQSVIGGRHIWGLPKELAVFEWSKDYVVIHQGDSPLCFFHYGQRGLSLSPTGSSKMCGKVFSVRDQDILLFEGKFAAALKWIKGSITIPIESPFAKFNLDHPWLTVQLQNLRLIADAPSVIGQLQTQF